MVDTLDLLQHCEEGADEDNHDPNRIHSAENLESCLKRSAKD
jgi:hypothetical protein